MFAGSARPNEDREYHLDVSVLLGTVPVGRLLPPSPPSAYAFHGRHIHMQTIDFDATTYSATASPSAASVMHGLSLANITIGHSGARHILL